MNPELQPPNLAEPGQDVDLLQRQVVYFASTLQAIANAYAHGPSGDGKPCHCAACVATRAIANWA